MIFRTPSYYREFHGIADRCKDNCCIGWGAEPAPADAFVSEP